MASETKPESFEIDPAGPYKGSERRETPRAPLRWTVVLACDGAPESVRTKTVNISRDGFYCVLNQFVKPGDRLECDIAVPALNPRNREDLAYLRCRAQAVRVERIGPGPEFGLACRIEDYHIVHSAAGRPGRRLD